MGRRDRGRIKGSGSPEGRRTPFFETATATGTGAGDLASSSQKRLEEQKEQRMKREGREIRRTRKWRWV